MSHHWNVVFCKIMLHRKCVAGQRIVLMKNPWAIFPQVWLLRRICSWTSKKIIIVLNFDLLMHFLLPRGLWALPLHGLLLSLWIILKNTNMVICMRAIFFQGLIGREIRTTVRIRWSFAQMCCAMSLVCLLITTHCTCQFWARSEPVNMPKTIESPTKCGVGAVIWFLYSEQATRNVVLWYSPSWQCSVAHCSCNKEAPEVFSMGSAWSSTIIQPDLAPYDFHLFPRMKWS